MMNQRPLLIVIGPPGAGKSVLGKRVARLLKVPFVDTDRRVVAKHGPIANIFSEHGEEWFRAAERVEVAKVLHERAVVSLGGGAILNPDTRNDLGSHRVVLVTVSPEAVARRLDGTVRPLLKDGLESWKRIARERQGIYEQLASRTIDSSQRAAGSMAHELAEWVAREEKE